MDASDRNKQCKKLLIQIEEGDVSFHVIEKFRKIYQPVIQEYLNGKNFNKKALSTIATDELSQKIGIRLEEQAENGIYEKDYEDSTQWIIKICTFDFTNWKCLKLLEQMKSENLRKNSFEKFYSLYHPIVKKYLENESINNIKLGESAVNDITQNVFLKILKMVVKKDKDGINITNSCKPYIMTICKNEFYNWIDKTSPEKNQMVITMLKNT